MRNTKATREDHNCLPLAGFLPGYFRLLIFLRWTSYKCPHCGKAFRWDFWPGNIRLGEGKRICSQCGTQFDDGSREWEQLLTVKKLRYFFPPLLIGISGGFLLASFVTIFLPDPDWRLTVCALVMALVPVFLWSLVRLPWVLRSIHRYNAMSPPR
jgi:DNA-directed RNA polymerase subunit RPC12/RpoP